MSQQLCKSIIDNTTGGRPFLKWTGGKRWLGSVIELILPKQYNRYIEPFLGGGALFFRLRTWPASLSDINAELIHVYRQVRDNLEDVIARLAQLEIGPKAYREIRARTPRLPVTRAVRFLYLNRTAFNGIYRVNRQGKFNVPFGCKPGTVLCDEDLLRRASRALQNRGLHVCDFEEAIGCAGPGDLIYADPPFTTRHDNNGFRRYNEVIFSWEDQVRLAKCCRRAVKRGAHVIVSNANHEPLAELYQDFCVKYVTRRSLISASADGRGPVKECLLYRVH
ncbi:MAG: Dam family site-specific DNA-(adenine-N6)-methyltransferase [Phycisphaerae bacterium]